MSETEQTPKRVTYDAPADVLYVTFEDAPAVKGTETTEGTVRRYGEGGKLIGVTIVDFSYRLQAGDIAPASLSREAALREALGSRWCAEFVHNAIPLADHLKGILEAMLEAITADKPVTENVKRAELQQAFLDDKMLIIAALRFAGAAAAALKSPAT